LEPRRGLVVLGAGLLLLVGGAGGQAGEAEQGEQAEQGQVTTHGRFLLVERAGVSQGRCCRLAGRMASTKAGGSAKPQAARAASAGRRGGWASAAGGRAPGGGGGATWPTGGVRFRRRGGRAGRRCRPCRAWAGRARGAGRAPSSTPPPAPGRRSAATARRRVG